MTISPGGFNNDPLAALHLGLTKPRLTEKSITGKAYCSIREDFMKCVVTLQIYSITAHTRTRANLDISRQGDEGLATSQRG